MANETLAQVPSDVSDPVALKRFLSSLVERLDVVLGYRGDSSYAYDTTVKDQSMVLDSGVLVAETGDKFAKRFSSIERRDKRLRGVPYD